MKCPACDNALSPTTTDSITVDVCKNGCGGLWFDAGELEKVDNATESAGEALLDMEGNGSSPAPNGQRMCPKCTGQPMMRHFASTRKQVEVDECPGCAGVWLDSGELGRIRAQYATEEDRKQAFDEYFDAVFGGELAKMQAENEAKAEKARRFARMFRYICPTNYIPGKQSWGAF